MTRLVTRWSRIVLGSTLLAVAAPAGGDAPSARFRLLETPVERPSEGAIDWSRIGVEGAPLTAQTEVLDLELPGGVRHTALRSRVDERRTGDFAWHGRIAGHGDDYQVLLTVSRGYVVGLIDAPEGAYEVTTTSDGGQVAMLLDQSLFPPCAGELEPTRDPHLMIVLGREDLDDVRYFRQNFPSESMDVHRLLPPEWQPNSYINRQPIPPIEASPLPAAVS